MNLHSGFSRIAEEEYDDFKSQPHHWSYVDRKFQDELDYYPNSPVSETYEEPSSPVLNNFVDQMKPIHF